MKMAQFLGVMLLAEQTTVFVFLFTKLTKISKRKVPEKAQK